MNNEQRETSLPGSERRGAECAIPWLQPTWKIIRVQLLIVKRERLPKYDHQKGGVMKINHVRT